MELNEIRQHLEFTLRPAEPPTLEEVLERVSRRGVLRGPVDWVFPAWMLYVEYATQKIAETFRLTEEEKRQLLDFRDTMKRLLLEAQRQAKEKLAALYKAVVEGTYRIKGKRLCASDDTWMYTNKTMYISIHGVGAVTHFPDVLKLPQEKLELLQLGWRASDEGEKGGRPYMGTTQPWQVFAWVATRYGKLHIYINMVVLTHEGASVSIRTKAKSWKQRWNKDEAIDLVINHFRRGEWTPLFAMWLGDGKSEQKRALHGEYKLVMAVKEPWRLGNRIDVDMALVATGKEAFVKLRDAAGVYGELLDILNAHKWINVKLATDDAFRIAYTLKTRKRNIDLLRAMYRQNNVETSARRLGRGNGRRKSGVVVAGIEMSLHLINNNGGSLKAEYYTRDLGKALEVAGRLESAGLRPNILKSKVRYIVYVPTTDLLRLAERDEDIRRVIALYLAEKAKNGTPRQRGIAEKILKRYPFLFTISSLHI
jgi:hypothetical protein